MKKQKIEKRGWEYLKTWVGIFQVGIFRVGTFQVGVFLIPSRRYREDNTQKQSQRYRERSQTVRGTIRRDQRLETKNTTTIIRKG